MQLDGRVAIVTGGASGIGRAIARRFAQAGAAVVIADRSATPLEGGQPTVDVIRGEGGRADFLQTDVARWADIDGLVSETVARHGRLDVMVNNAAISRAGRLTETTQEDWEATLEVNLTGVFLGCKRAVQQMLTQAPTQASGGEVRGRIVNISSQHGMIAAPGHMAYGVSKAGVVYLTRQIAADYAKDGIVCNAVAPGKIITGHGITGHGITGGGSADGPGGGLGSRDPDILAYARSRTPWPRLGRPGDVAGAALFLASDQATYITGENLMVDGGWMAG